MLNPPAQHPIQLDSFGVVDLVPGSEHRAKMNQANDDILRLARIVDELRDDIDTIKNALEEEATRRDWCDEWEFFWNSLTLSYHPPLEQTYEVKFIIELTRRQVIELENHIDKFLPNVNCNSFDYEVV